MAAPLDGIRVVDLGVVVAGTTATMLLADLGAEVIRVESTQHFTALTRGQFARPAPELVGSQPPIVGGYPDRDPGERPWNRFPIFNATARNKLGMTVDLDREPGPEIFRRLVAVSDVLVTNQTPGSLESRGLGYADLAAVNPGLVHVEATPYGATGPYAGWRAYGHHLEAAAGHDRLRHYRDLDVDSNTWEVAADAGAAQALALAALLGLHARERTGRGQSVDLSMLEAFVGMVGPSVLEATVNGTTPVSLGNRDPNAIQGSYPCAGDDRWVVLTVPDDAAWERLVVAMGRPDWTRDGALSTVTGRYAAHDRIDAGIADWTRVRTREEVVASLRAAGVLVGPVLDDADLSADPHLAERGWFVEVDHPEAGRHRYPGPAWRFRDAPFEVRHPPVRLGEHNAYVYRELLGYSEPEYRRFEELGHVGTEYAPHIQ